MPITVAAEQFVVKLRWRCEGDAEEVISTIGAQGVAAPTPIVAPEGKTAAQAVADKFSAAVLQAWSIGGQSHFWTFTGVDVQEGPMTGGGDQATNANFRLGTGQFNTPPINTAVLVRKLTGVGGKRFRGRMFLPPAYTNVSDVNSAGMLSSTALNSHGAALDLFQEYLEEDQDECSALKLMLFHGTVPTEEPGTPIVDLVVQPQVATQRRRMRN